MDHVLPLRAAARLFDFLSVVDRNALVHTYPGLAHAYAAYRARTRPWQARFPVEIAQAVLEYLGPADYYATCCVCSFWRCCAMNARMLKAQLDVAMQNSCTSASDLADVTPIADDARTEDLWLYFLVAAPRRYMFNDGMRRNRVVSLDFRRALAASNRTIGIFISDYGGIIALSGPTGLILHSIDDLLPNAYETPPSASALGTLPHPRGVLSSQLVDVSIAHQQGTSGQFHVFALYDGGSVFRAGVQLVSAPETHLKQATFTRFTLVSGGPPYISTAECEWSGVPPASSFRALKIAAIAPAAPARAMIALKANSTSANGNAYVSLVRTDLDPAPGRELVVRTKRSIAALDVLRLRSRLSIVRAGAASDGGKPWDLLTLSFPDVAKTDWRAQQSDRLAVQEVFLEWLHEHVGHLKRTPILKSMDIGSGLHLTLEDLTPLTARLSHKGMNWKYAAGARLPTPTSLSPLKVCAIQYVQRALLIAVYWGAPHHAIYLYEGLPADVVAGRATPRLLVRFGASARVADMRFFGGFTSAPEEPPCSGKIVLTVTMRAGFVHVVQFTTADLNTSVEWAIPVEVKLQRATPGTFGWRDEWTIDADGTMQS